MVLLRKSQSRNITEYAPIAKALSTLDADSETKLKKKFDIVYLICKEQLLFTKVATLCELDKKHEVNLGLGYIQYRSAER